MRTTPDKSAFVPKRKDAIVRQHGTSYWCMTRQQTRHTVLTKVPRKFGTCATEKELSQKSFPPEEKGEGAG